MNALQTSFRKAKELLGISEPVVLQQEDTPEDRIKYIFGPEGFEVNAVEATDTLLSIVKDRSKYVDAIKSLNEKSSSIYAHRTRYDGDSSEPIYEMLDRNPLLNALGAPEEALKIAKGVMNTGLWHREKDYIERAAKDIFTYAPLVVATDPELVASSLHLVREMSAQQNVGWKKSLLSSWDDAKKTPQAHLIADLSEKARNMEEGFRKTIVGYNSYTIVEGEKVKRQDRDGPHNL